LNPPWERHSPTEWRINYGTLVIASLQWGAPDRWGDRRYAYPSIRARPEREFRGVIGPFPLDETGQPSPLPWRIDRMIRDNWPEVYGND
jgi:hypothetical protein